jgi:hypothetical protein
VKSCFSSKTDAFAERLCFLLLELLGFLQLGLQEVERFRWGVVVDRVHALVVEIVHHGSGGVLWRDVEQLVQGEGAEGTRELLGSLILRLRRTRRGGRNGTKRSASTFFRMVMY